MFESLSKDQTVSWVRTVNGIDKCVTETSEEIPIENVQLFMSTGRPVATAKPRLKKCCESNHQRTWIDTDTQPFSQSCFAVSKFMITLLRHGRTCLEKTMEQYDLTTLLVKEFNVKFVGTLQWTVDD